MVEVPLVPLGNMLRESPRNGLSPRPSDAPPGLPILRISAATSRQDGIVDEADHKYLEVSEREALQYKVQPGDLLACRFNGNLRFVGRFALYRGYLGKHHIYPDKLIRFRVDTARVLPEFVLLAINSRQSRAVIESFCSTTAGNIGISAANLKTVPIPVLPLHEQRRIVRRVEDLTTRIERARGLRQKAAQEVEVALPSALLEARDAMTREYKAVPLGRLADVKGGGTPSTQNAAFWGGDIPWVTPKDMKQWELTDSEDHITQEAVHQSALKWIEPGAVLVVTRGMILARAFPVALARARITINQDMKALVPRPGNGLFTGQEFMPEYLAYMLRASEQDILERVEIAGHGTRRLRTEVLTDFPLPLPPLLEQQRIVAYLSGVHAKVDALRRMQAESATELDALLPTVLNRAFKGEL